MKYQEEVEEMNLKQLREQAGLSQAELGSMVGLKQTTISQYENRTRQPNLVIAKKIADVLNISLDELVYSITFQNEIQDNYKSER